MEAAFRKVDEVIIVDLSGRFVMGEAVETFRQMINQLVVESQKNILLNLSEVEWIDSSGIGELVSSLKMAESFGASVKLLRIGDKVRHVLSISRLLPLLAVYENEEDAIQAFKTPAGESEE